jgi:hypothetical protein
MKSKREGIQLSSAWHVDCRIEAELPDDNLIGRRFLINLVFSAVAMGALLITGWLGYVALILHNQINDWEKRIAENRAEVSELQLMQRQYDFEAAKIDQAYSLLRPRVFVSELIANLGRTRPDRMTIDMVELNELGVVLRGSVGETSERATRLLSGYVEQLRRHEKIGSSFKEIRLTALDRGGIGGALRFEINLFFKSTGGG